MGIKIYQVDAFTDTPFCGNPAAVCILPEPREDNWMQNVAREMNLSETAFVVEAKDGYDLRWFTPSVEVDLCGHATLASAHILWEQGFLEADEEINFHTKSGLLKATKNAPWIELDFPAKPPEGTTVPRELIKAIGVTPKYTGRNLFDYIIEVESEKVLRELQPDFQAIRQLNVRGVIVTCRAEQGNYDFVSRFFAPGVGVNEDPVTGSAHCCLGPYWKERLNKEEFLAYQASARGGYLRVRVNGDRVTLGGKAITVLSGELIV